MQKVFVSASFRKLVMTEGNTLLSDAELEMLVVLQMNRGFMEFMRTKHYAYLPLQQFLMAVVDEVDNVESVEV